MVSARVRGQAQGETRNNARQTSPPAPARFRRRTRFQMKPIQLRVVPDLPTEFCLGPAGESAGDSRLRCETKPSGARQATREFRNVGANQISVAATGRVRGNAEGSNDRMAHLKRFQNECRRVEVQRPRGPETSPRLHLRLNRGSSNLEAATNRDGATGAGCTFRPDPFGLFPHQFKSAPARPP